MSKKEESFIKEIKIKLQEGKSKFAIYPYGKNGRKFVEILKKYYDIEPEFIIDNKLCGSMNNIISLSDAKEKDVSDVVFVMTCENIKYRKELMNDLLGWISRKNIIDVGIATDREFKTNCGKYSYGPLCDHWLVESVGAFCSFALGTDVVVNHPISFISTAPFLYFCNKDNSLYAEYMAYKHNDWYMDGVSPLHGVKMSRIKIGNDVWLGKNVIITNYANIADGAIVGAGAVVTKDIPAYAMAVGVPAKIIKYRYKADEIEAMEKISWWDWPDEIIRKRYADFYLPAKDFIKKYNT